MKKSKKILSLVVIATYLLLLYGDISPLAKTEHKLKVKQENLQNMQDSLTRDVEINNHSLSYINEEFAQKTQDSIAKFNEYSGIDVALSQNDKQIKNLQIQIAQTAELAWNEYWQKNFSKYKHFIDSKFTKQDVLALEKYVGKAAFSLTNCPEVDYNYCNNIDDILYGPYWDYIAEYIKKTDPKLAKRYIRIRTLAEQKYPYIFAHNVFYFGPTITKFRDSGATITQQDVLFSEAILFGADSISSVAYADKANPQEYMYDFNSLRNICSMFTTNLHYFIESIFLDEDNECIDINCPVFASHRAQLLDLTQQLEELSDKKSELNLQKQKAHKDINKYFDNAKRKTKNMLKKQEQELANKKIKLEHESIIVQKQLDSLTTR